MRHVVEEIFDVIENIPQQRTPERVPARTVDVPVSTNEIHEVVQITPEERISERTLEQIVDMPVPQILEAVVEVIDAPVLQFQEELVEVIQLIPQDRIPERNNA